MKKKKIIKSISFRQLKTMEEAKKRAKALGLSFSAYIALLIESDLEERNDLVVREKSPKKKETKDEKDER